MIFYILFFVCIVIFPILNRFKLIEGIKISGFTFSFILIFLLSALRFDVGYDYSMYYGLIEGNIKYFNDQINRIEYLPRLLILFSNKLGFYQFFFIITSMLISYFFYKSIKQNSYDKWLSTLIFVCFPIFFFMSLSVVRQYVAISIVFFGYKYIKERNFLLYFCLILLTTFIHKSAIIALPIYFLFGDFLVNKKMILFIYLFSFFSSDVIAFLIRQISERYAIYIGEIGGEGGNMILIFFQLIGFFLLPIVYNSRDRKDKEFNFYLLTFYIGLFIWSTLSKFGHAGIRGSLYYIVFIILLLPKFRYKIKQYRMVRQLMVIICFLFFFINLYIGTRHKIKDANLPYQTFFFKNSEDFKPNE